jgi:CHASE2 domain-containing sensor protein
MSVQTLKPSYAVEIIVPGYGSAYRIGGRLVLTCAHLFKGVTNGECKVRSKSDFGIVTAKLVWTASDVDIALVELPEKVDTCEAITFGLLPDRTNAETVDFEFYGWPKWSRTQAGSTEKAEGRHIYGDIHLSDSSSEGFLVLEAKRLPPEAPLGNIGSAWEGVSGAAIVCNGLVIAVQSRHQRPDRVGSLEAELLSTIYQDKIWCSFLEKHGIDPKPKKIVPTDKEYKIITKPLSTEENRISKRVKRLAELGIITLSSLAITALVSTVRAQGWLQPLEWWTFDMLMSHRPQEEIDPRILVVEVTDNDVWAQEGGKLPLHDEKVLQILKKLDTYQPQVIGLDIYRDTAQPEGNKSNKSLLEYFQSEKSDNLVVVCNSAPATYDGAVPPKGLEEFPENLGFSNVTKDNDDTIRRHLLTRYPEKDFPCKTENSLSFEIALRYLEDKYSIQLEQTEVGEYIKLKDVVFESLPLDPPFGAYHKFLKPTTRGRQVFLNYRSGNNAFQKVTLTEILNDKDNSKFSSIIKDKIVLIGYTATMAQDVMHATPYRRVTGKMPGVIVNAHMVSQITSSVLDGRPLLRISAPYGEFMWIFIWATIEGALVYFLIPLRRFSYVIIILSLLFQPVLCYFFLLNGFWMALVPLSLAVVGTVTTIIFLNRKTRLSTFLVQDYE